MDDIYVLILAITQIPICFILITRRFCQTQNYLLYKRNPDWMASHPQFKSHERAGNLLILFSYILSAGTLFAIIKFAWITPKPEYYASLLFDTQFIWLLGIGLYVVVLYKSVIRKIPVPSVREASLRPRKISAYLPMWAVYLVYVLLAAVLAVYVYGLFNGIIDNEVARKRLTGLSVVIVVATCFLFFSIHRKKSPTELWFGPSGRKLDAYITLCALYLEAILSVYLILNDFFGVLLLSPNSVAVLLSVLIQAFFVISSFHPRVKAMNREYMQNCRISA